MQLDNPSGTSWYFWCGQRLRKNFASKYVIFLIDVQFSIYDSATLIASFLGNTTAGVIVVPETTQSPAESDNSESIGILSVNSY